MKVIVGKGSCGIAAGANEVYDKLEALSRENPVPDVDLGITGCIGMCFLEPIVDIYPNKDSSECLRLVHVKGEDARTIRMVSGTGYTIPYLMYMTVEPNSDQISKMNAAVWIHDRWVDLTGIYTALAGESEKGFLETLLDSGLLGALGNAVLASGKPADFPKALILHVGSGETVEIPNTGLENMALEQNMAGVMNRAEEAAEMEIAMSRPKG